MLKFLNYILFDHFGRLFGLMILTGICLVLGEKLDNAVLYSIGSILAIVSLAVTIYIFIISNFS